MVGLSLSWKSKTGLVVHGPNLPGRFLSTGAGVAGPRHQQDRQPTRPQQQLRQVRGVADANLEQVAGRAAGQRGGLDTKQGTVQ